MPAAIDLVARRKQLEQLPLGHLTLIGPVRRRGAHLYITATCSACGRRRKYVVNNVLRGRTTDCQCQRAVKYGNKPLATIFGQRYDAVQRRLPNKKRSRHDDRSGFPDREAFVRYMLDLATRNRPKITTPKQLRKFRITRLNKRRGFEKGNLGLVRGP
jgi:hypothetical protein